MSEIPGPRSLPIIGNLHKLKKPPCLTFSEFARIHGEVFRVKLGSTRNVILNSEESLRQAFDVQGTEFADRDNSFTSFRLYNEIRGRECTGLTVRSADTDIWHVQHTVTRRAIRHYVFDMENRRFEKAILSEAEKLVATWLPKDNSCSIDPTDSLGQIISTLKAVCILGDVRNGIEDFDKKLKDYTAASFEMLADMRSGFINDFLPCLKFATKSKQNKMRDILCIGARFFDDIYKAHEASYKDGSKDTIMDCFATFHEEMEKEEPGRYGVPRKTVYGVISELFEGVANSTAAFTQIMLYMVYFPEIQDKVREELRQVVGIIKYPSFEDRSNLPYTEAVMYEVWRHSSVINVTVPHTATQNTVLGGRFNYFIPKGTTVIGNLFSIHKDPKMWDNPEDFNPSRFLSEEGVLDEDKVKQCMIFSIGKRSCIAELIVRRELFLLYSTLVHLCKFENEGPPLTMQEVLGVAVPCDGSCKIKITRTDVDINCNLK